MSNTKLLTLCLCFFALLLGFQLGFLFGFVLGMLLGFCSVFIRLSLGLPSYARMRIPRQLLCEGEWLYLGEGCSFHYLAYDRDPNAAGAQKPVKPSAEDDAAERWREFQDRAKAAPVRVGSRASAKSYVEANAECIAELKSKGYRYADVAEMLNGVGIAITAQTLEYYYAEARRKRAVATAKPGSKPSAKPSAKPSKALPKAVSEPERPVNGEARANPSVEASAGRSKVEPAPSGQAALGERTRPPISSQVARPAEQTSGKLADAMRYMGEDEA